MARKISARVAEIVVWCAVLLLGLKLLTPIMQVLNDEALVLTLDVKNESLAN